MNPTLLTSAFALDLLMGDPLWLPHPVRLMGRGIAALEITLRRCIAPRTGEKFAGCVLMFTVVAVAFACTASVIAIGRWVHPSLGGILTIYFSYTALATKSLASAAKGIREALKNAALPLARKRLSQIVSRETDTLSDKAVIRVTVETVAENTSDGIVAPFFYLALGGPALAMAYKAINTLDSMVGYQSKRYHHFGWASAKCDDFANYLPARITGFLMCFAAVFLKRRGAIAFKIMRRDGQKHDSPNAGIPEAATAGALGIQLGGPSLYGGILKEKPWLGEAEEKPVITHIQDSICLMRGTAILMWFSAVLVLILVGQLG